MTFLNWSWHPLTLLLIALFVWLYVRGWRRLRTVTQHWVNERAGPNEKPLANEARLALFLVSIGLLLLVTVSPMYALSGYYLSLRALQKVIVCMIAAPLLLLACPFHMIAWGLPVQLRMLVTRLVLRRSNMRNAIATVTQSGIAWMLYLGAFLVWHEPTFASWSSQSDWSRMFFLWLLFYVSLIFWGHITHTGPRIHKELPGWIMIVYLLGVEIPNMFTGVSIAFSGAPIYEYYLDVQSRLPEVNAQLMRLTTLEDQMIGGGLTWVIGSAVYVTGIVMVLNKLFKREKDLPPRLALSTEPTDRTIAPGLEHRVQKHRWQQAGYGDAKSDV